MEGRHLFTGAPPDHRRRQTSDRGLRISRRGREDRQGWQTSEVQAPAGAVRVDLSGKTVIPALVNAHGHVGFQKDVSFEKANYTRETIVNQLRQYAYYGVGAVMTAGTDAGDISYQLRAQPVAGAALLRTAGRGFAMPNAGPGGAAMRDAAYGVTTEAEARKDVQELAAKKPDLMKIWVDDRGGSVQKLTPALYRAIIDEAHRHKIRVMAHVFYLTDARDLVEAGVDGFLHSVRDAEMDDALVARMKQKNVYITPNLSINGRGVATQQPPWFDDPILAEVFSPAAIARARPGQNQNADAGRKGNAANPNQPSSYEMQIRSLAKLTQGGRDDRARRRQRHPEQLPRLRGAAATGADGRIGDDAAAGARCSHAHGGRSSAPQRHGLDRAGQERELRRARRQPAREPRQRQEDLESVSARTGNRSRGAALAVDGRNERQPLLT